MFNLTVPWWEFVVRGIVVYVFLFGMLRMTGKRQVGQLAPFDLILLLILSNAVQNSMNAGDDSLIGGLISATTLILINQMVAYWTYHDKRVETLIEGKPLVLVRNGRICTEIMDNELITKDELKSAIRGSGVFSLSDVKLAVLETNGRVSVSSRE